MSNRGGMCSFLQNFAIYPSKWPHFNSVLPGIDLKWPHIDLKQGCFDMIWHHSVHFLTIIFYDRSLTTKKLPRFNSIWPHSVLNCPYIETEWPCFNSFLPCFISFLMTTQKKIGGNVLKLPHFESLVQRSTTIGNWINAFVRRKTLIHHWKALIQWWIKPEMFFSGLSVHR
jgi:hypothetical protein